MKISLRGLRGLYKKIGCVILMVGLLVAVGITARTVSVKETTTQRVLQKPTVQVQQPVVEQQPIEKKSPGGKLSLEAIHALALEQESSQALSKNGSIARAIKVEPATQLKSDLFTQSQAHMSLPEIKKLIADNYDVKPYEKIIALILEREKKYTDDYVFYHGTDNIWRIPQDLYTQLYFHFNKLPAELQKSFIFLRFGSVFGPPVMKNFLLSTLKEEGLINDHALGAFLFAVNLALFGNVGLQPECTWQYFVKSRGHLAPTRAIYEAIMDKFGLSHKYIDELMALVNLYQTKEQTIIQLFVPKDRVDEIGYISWIKGIPAHKKTMDMVLHSVKNKTFAKTAPAIEHYAELFKNEKENNPIFKNLVEHVKAGDFSLSYFLKFYRNHPEAIEGINNFEARLVFTPQVLLNPLSGVKVFRYSTATPEQLKQYEQKFGEIFKKIIAEKNKSAGNDSLIKNR